MIYVIIIILIGLAFYFYNAKRTKEKMEAGEKQILAHLGKIMSEKPGYFKNYWDNLDTQVVAFSLDWEIAGESEETIWNINLSSTQKKQPFIWVHPPEEDEEDIIAHVG